MILAEAQWRERARAHAAGMDRWLAPHHDQVARGAKHPVYDFLFDYYPFRPSHLRQWHPGPGVILAGAAARDYLRFPAYRETRDGVTIDPARWPARRREFLPWLRQLLRATRERPPHFGCFGLHEWAMVYRLEPHEVRHTSLPLRMEPAALAAFVESQVVTCSHFDAFRFFTPAARPLNRLQPARATAPDLEQCGCLHANMDLYKWAGKLLPFTPGELLADCFALACELRELDMRASAYDVRPLGFEPVPIETPAGREEYVRRQRELSERSQPLRGRLLELVDALVGSMPVNDANASPSPASSPR